MATTVAAMLASIQANLGAEDGDVGLDETRLLEDLNQVYRFDLADRYGGGRFRKKITFDATASGGVDSEGIQYDLHDEVYTATPGDRLFSSSHTRVFLKTSAESRSSPLRVYTAEDEFFGDYEITTTSTGRPSAVLVMDSLLRFNLIPDQTYEVALWVTEYRAALTADDSLGLEFEDRAIQYAATAYAAARIGMQDVLALFAPLSRQAFAALRGRSQGGYHEPSHAVDF